MITAACFLPHPPLLLAEYASRTDPGRDLRARCRRALSELAETAPAQVLVVTGTDRVAPATSTRRPLGLRVAGELLATAPGLPVATELSVPFDAGPREIEAAASWVRDSAAGARTGLVVVGDGSARRGEKAPGHVDERSLLFDALVTQALATGDPESLGRLDAQVAAELLVAGWAAWQVLAAAVDGPAEVISAYADDPFGVLYQVAVWRWS